MKRAMASVDVGKAQAKYPEDLKMILDLASRVRTQKYGEGLKAINRMGKMALANVLSNAELSDGRREGMLES